MSISWSHRLPFRGAMLLAVLGLAPLSAAERAGSPVSRSQAGESSRPVEVATYEDASGDLIYTAYNFVDAANARPVELAENGRTTSPFSVEVRDGAEAQTPQALSYTFETQGFRYVVTLNRDGTGTLDAFRDGALLQSEPLAGYQQGTAPAQ